MKLNGIEFNELKYYLIECNLFKKLYIPKKRNNIESGGQKLSEKDWEKIQPEIEKLSDKIGVPVEQIKSQMQEQIDSKGCSVKGAFLLVRTQYAYLRRQRGRTREFIGRVFAINGPRKTPNNRVVERVLFITKVDGEIKMLWANAWDADTEKTKDLWFGKTYKFRMNYVAPDRLFFLQDTVFEEVKEADLPSCQDIIKEAYNAKNMISIGDMSSRVTENLRDIKYVLLGPVVVTDRRIQKGDILYGITITDITQFEPVTCWVSAEFMGWKINEVAKQIPPGSEIVIYGYVTQNPDTQEFQMNALAIYPGEDL
jgi:hypothetical protein